MSTLNDNHHRRSWLLLFYSASLSSGVHSLFSDFLSLHSFFLIPATFCRIFRSMSFQSLLCCYICMFFLNTCSCSSPVLLNLFFMLYILYFYLLLISKHNIYNKELKGFDRPSLCKNFLIFFSLFLVCS